MTRDNMYHPNHNWTLLVQEHLNKSLDEEGLIRQSHWSKSALFISHPLPECSCRLSSVEAPIHVKGDDGQIFYGGEEECPKWMQHDEVISEDGKSDDGEFAEYESDPFEHPESSDGGKTNVSLVFDQDEEMDPND